MSGLIVRRMGEIILPRNNVGFEYDYLEDLFMEDLFLEDLFDLEPPGEFHYNTWQFKFRGQFTTDGYPLYNVFVVVTGNPQDIQGYLGLRVVKFLDCLVEDDGRTLLETACFTKLEFHTSSSTRQQKWISYLLDNNCYAKFEVIKQPHYPVEITVVRVCES